MAPVTFVKKPDQKEDFEEELKDIGKRLAYLLAVADLPQDVKESWATLVPEMTLEQIDKLMVILERYVTSGISKEFESFKTDLLKIQQKHGSYAIHGSNTHKLSQPETRRTSHL